MPPSTDKVTESIYKLKCLDCDICYIGESPQYISKEQIIYNSKNAKLGGSGTYQNRDLASLEILTLNILNFDTLLQIKYTFKKSSRN